MFQLDDKVKNIVPLFVTHRPTEKINLVLKKWSL